MKTILIIFFSFSVFAQSDLFIPRNIKDAYEKGTRSYDGTPGENYWQNSAKYNIKVNVEPETRLVKGWEKIIYFNNSPDTLDRIIFNIIQDLNKYETERSFPISREALSEGVDIQKLVINDSEINVNDNNIVRRRNTLMTLYIKDNPLQPQSSIEFEIEWSFIIPMGRNPRMGAYDSTTFFVAYFYPQVAVYDDVFGWDNLAHTGEQEFYNDFSDYDIEITVPNTFGVWGTGILQNPEDVLNNEYLERYRNAWQSDDVINIINRDELKKGNIYNTDSENNTWKYKVDNITDFTFGMSDHFLWDAVSLIVDKETDRRTYIAAVYKEESEDFYEVADIARKAIDYYSNELPGVPYPFPSLTVFNGTGGMEFPMIINDGSEVTRPRTVSVTSHEIAHQYFPFYMGINEEKYGWMDEGMATFLPYEFQKKEGKYEPFLRVIRFYESLAGTEMEMPMMIPTYLLSGWVESLAAYYRPALSYYFLRDALGSELYGKCLREYMNRWNGKHPIPYDYFFTFNEISGKDLGWYWKPWYFERGNPDLAIKDASYHDGTIEITIEKKGSIPTPVFLSINCDDSSVIEIYESAMIWENNKNTAVIKREISAKPTSVFLGSQLIPDVDKKNNSYIFSH